MRTTRILACLLALHLPAHALAQANPEPPADRSPADLRAENDRLRERLAELETELAESRRRIARLEDLVRSLRRELAEADVADRAADGPAGPTPAPESQAGGESRLEDPTADSAAPIPDDPYAAPDALQRRLTLELANEFAAAPPTEQRDLNRYLADLRRWARIASQTYRAPVDWLVQIVDRPSPTEPPAPPPPPIAIVQIIEQETGRTIGEPFPLTLGPRELARLNENREQEAWILSGVIAAAPVVNPERRDQGLFNTPPLLGPYVEFGYDFSVRALRPAEPSATVSAPN